MEVSESTSKSLHAGRTARPKPPIEIAIRSWLGILPPELLSGVDSYLENLLLKAPKRWVVYSPMVLLPSGSFGEDWWEAVGSPQIVLIYADQLWSLILEGIGQREGKGSLTHLAINSGIPLHKAPDQGADTHDENILRTPSGLIMLHGDFGPALSPETLPREQDFKEAFWVNTKQNGITQIWAPRYTMFSRGNVKEKARLLDFHNRDQTSVTRRVPRDELASNSAVDLYAGIGYFVFSYVKMGMRKVVGWELNPWSVEGLRRGAVANGWNVKIVRSQEDLDFVEGQIVVFLEDNRKAAERLHGRTRPKFGPIQHVNCGLLPTSQESWETAVEILDGDGWLHLHENVGVDDVPSRKAEIEELVTCWVKRPQDGRVAKVEHVEYVKTFAPGVWHCVFDVYIYRPDAQ